MSQTAGGHGSGRTEQTSDGMGGADRGSVFKLGSVWIPKVLDDWAALSRENSDSDTEFCEPCLVNHQILYCRDAIGGEQAPGQRDKATDQTVGIPVFQ